MVIAFLEQKHNTDTLRNGFPISMYQGGPLHEPYFIVLRLQDQPIIGPNKTVVTSHMVSCQDC